MPAASAIKVLIVDDQLTSRALIRDGLQQLGIVDQCAAQRGALLHATRQLMGKPVFEAR